MTLALLRAPSLRRLSALSWVLGAAACLLCAGCGGSPSFTSSYASLRSIGVNAASPVVYKGSIDQMTAIGVLPDGTALYLTDQVQWSSSNSSVAKVSNVSGEAGLVEGVSVGMVTISARLDGITGSTQLLVR